MKRKFKIAAIVLAPLILGVVALLVVMRSVLLEISYEAEPTEIRRGECQWDEGVITGGSGNMRYLTLDHYSYHHLYRVSNDDNLKQMALRISGKFPHARFLSFNFGDISSMDMVGSLTDYEIIPELGSQNPFQNEINRQTTDRDYTFWLLPEGSNIDKENGFQIPENTNRFQMTIRVYGADQSQNALGGELPKIEAFKLSSLEAGKLEITDCPSHSSKSAEAQSGGMLNIIVRLFKRNYPPQEYDAGKTIRFFRTPVPKGATEMNGAHIVSKLDTSHGDVAIIKVRVPQYPKTRDGRGVFKQDDEIRYMSICSYDSIIPIYFSLGCVFDEGMKINEESMAVVVFSSDDRIRQKTESLGLNFLPMKGYRPWLMQRQFVPHKNFEGNFRDIVPVATVDEKFSKDLAADNFVGAYAPTGGYCDQDAFLKLGLDCLKSE